MVINEDKYHNYDNDEWNDDEDDKNGKCDNHGEVDTVYYNNKYETNMLMRINMIKLLIRMKIILMMMIKEIMMMINDDWSDKPMIIILINDGEDDNVVIKNDNDMVYDDHCVNLMITIMMKMTKIIKTTMMEKIIILLIRMKIWW